MTTTCERRNGRPSPTLREYPTGGAPADREIDDREGADAPPMHRDARPAGVGEGRGTIQGQLANARGTDERRSGRVASGNSPTYGVREYPKGGAPASGGPCFSLATLLGDIARHPELDIDTLTYHARQSDATAVDGYWHASINEARSFLEALVVGMLRRVYVEPEDEYPNPSRKGTPFRSSRRRLMEAGFLDADENDVLQYVYGLASAKGSHHGVTDKAWTGLIRGMVCTTAAYLLARYEAWKSAGMIDPNLGTLDKLGRRTRLGRVVRFGASAMGKWAARGRNWVMGS